jgi:hypothetical protein
MPRRAFRWRTPIFRNRLEKKTMRPCSAVSFLSLLAALVPAGCSGDATCGAITGIPPLFTILTATGSTECSPTFRILGGPEASVPDGGGAGPVRCPGVGCPVLAVEGGDAGCSYVLTGFEEYPSGSYSVEISEPGFVPVVVSNVNAGRGGCVPTVPASQSLVTLVPLRDAAADAR